MSTGPLWIWLSNWRSESVSESCMMDGQGFELLAVKTFLDEAALRAPGFTVGGEQALAEEVAHAFHLDVGLLVVLGVGLEDVLNDGGIDGDDRLFNATEIEAERVAELTGVGLQDLDGIGGRGARVGEGTKAGNGWNRWGQCDASLSWVLRRGSKRGNSGDSQALAEAAG